jgi:hypothetical protein
MKIAIGIIGTGNYWYASNALARRVADAVRAAKGVAEVVLVVVGDVDERVEQAGELICNRLHTVRGVAVKHEVIGMDDLTFGDPYGKETQISIARMWQEAFDFIKMQGGADYFWCIEADVLPADNALRCMLDSLKFDDGYYSISMATYPSQGGGSFLGGFGTARNPIAEDFVEEERELTEEYKALKQEFEEKAAAKKESPDAVDDDILSALQDKLRQTFRELKIKGNVFEMNGKAWRRRGWLEHAYPAIGKGAMVPVDWVGMGCTLLNKQAFELASFSGYHGAGTQDLFLCWHRWHPAGLRMVTLTHCPCSHVVRERKKNGEQDFKSLYMLRAFHEPDGEFKDHLRWVKEPWTDI